MRRTQHIVIVQNFFNNSYVQIAMVNNNKTSQLRIFCRDLKKIVKTFKDEGGMGVTDVDVKLLYNNFMVRIMKFS